MFRYDDTNPEGRTARMLADDAIQRGAGRGDPVATSNSVMREAGSRYIDFLVPGLVGLGIMSNTLWGLGFSIVDARRRKLTKRLIATPMSRASYLLSYLVWRMMVLVVEVGVPVGFGVLAFGVPVRGRLIDLVVVSVLASLSFSALALLIASRARTIEAVSGLMNLAQVPMWILSGVFFSAQRFPDVVQPFIAALPLTALIDALRANMLQGAGLGELLPELGVLAGVARDLFRAGAEAVPLAVIGYRVADGLSLPARTIRRRPQTIRRRRSTSIAGPDPAAQSSAMCMGFPVPGMTVVTAGCARTYLSSSCDQRSQP